MVRSSRTKQAGFAFHLNVLVSGGRERFAFLLEFTASYQFLNAHDALAGRLEGHGELGAGLRLLRALTRGVGSAAGGCGAPCPRGGLCTFPLRHLAGAGYRQQREAATAGLGARLLAGTGFPSE